MLFTRKVQNIDSIMVSVVDCPLVAPNAYRQDHPLLKLFAHETLETQASISSKTRRVAPPGQAAVTGSSADGNVRINQTCAILRKMNVPPPALLGRSKPPRQSNHRNTRVSYSAAFAGMCSDKDLNGDDLALENISRNFQTFGWLVQPNITF